MNLLSIFNRNVILTGPVDSYCLVCEHLLLSDDECLAHIDDGTHIQNLYSAPVLDKYQRDNIVKVKLGYYCLYCNVFLKTVTKVGLHVSDNNHKQLKIIRSVRWENSIMLAFEEIQIQEYAFHGIFDNTCLVCNTDEISGHLETHIEDNCHILELIKNNKYVLGDNYIYRMVDESAFFCIICAKVYGDSQMADHNISNEHKTNYSKGKELATQFFSGGKKDEVKANKDDKTEGMQVSYEKELIRLEPEKELALEVKNKEIASDNGQVETKHEVAHDDKTPYESIVQSKPQNFGENLENKFYNKNEIAQKENTNTTEIPTTLRPCVETIEVGTSNPPQPKPEGKKKKRKEQDTKIEIVDNKTKMQKENDKYIENNIYIDFNTETVFCERCDEDLYFDYQTLDDHLKESHDQSFKDQDLDWEITQFAYENYMRIIEGKAYCKLCEEDVNTNLEDMKDHVNFYIHIDIVMGKTGFGPLTKTTAKDFFQTLVGVESSLTSEVVVNNSLVVTLKSFHTVVDVDREMSCTMCQKELKPIKGDAFMQHIATTEHKELLSSCNVVTSVQNELVRELRPGVYHCGYCNMGFASWFLAVSHICTRAHGSSKRHALWALERSRHVTRNARPTQIGALGHATIA